MEQKESGAYNGKNSENSGIENGKDNSKKRKEWHNTFEDDGSFVKLCTYQTGAAAYGAAMDVMEEFLRTV